MGSGSLDDVMIAQQTVVRSVALCCGVSSPDCVICAH